jgi:hypothetical protein
VNGHRLERLAQRYVELGVHDGRRPWSITTQEMHFHEEAVHLIEDEFNAKVIAAWNYDERARAAQRPVRETKAES